MCVCVCACLDGLPGDKHGFTPMKIPPYTLHGSQASCLNACARRKNCAGYYYNGNQCYDLIFSDNRLVQHPPNAPPSGPSMLLPSGPGTARVKIPNCQMHQTCIMVSVQGQDYLSGSYCPVVGGVSSEVIHLHSLFFKRHCPLSPPIQLHRNEANSIMCEFFSGFFLFFFFLFFCFRFCYLSLFCV